MKKNNYLWDAKRNDFMQTMLSNNINPFEFSMWLANRMNKVQQTHYKEKEKIFEDLLKTVSPEKENFLMASEFCSCTIFHILENDNQTPLLKEFIDSFGAYEELTYRYNDNGKVIGINISDNLSIHVNTYHYGKLYEIFKDAEKAGIAIVNLSEFIVINHFLDKIQKMLVNCGDITFDIRPFYTVCETGNCNYAKLVRLSDLTPNYSPDVDDYVIMLMKFLY